MSWMDADNSMDYASFNINGYKDIHIAATHQNERVIFKVNSFALR